MLPFTLVSTVYNERARLEQTLADLLAQTLPPSELIVVDAGSTDGTAERLAAFATQVPYPVRVFVVPRATIAQGRNRAIKEACFPLIASTDFGCRFAPSWLASIIAPFGQDPALHVVGGAFTIIQTELTTPAARADYMLSGGYPADTSGLFSVSSRSIAYKKTVWEQLGGYQEWLTLAADDTIFWRQIKHSNLNYRLVNEPMVYWLRHTTYTGFGKENYRYGLGDGESGINKRNFFSHLAETASRYVGAAGLLATIGSVAILQNFALGLLAVFAGAFLTFGLRSYVRAYKNYAALRPKNYTLFDLKNAFYLVEITRWYYIRGYVQGWLLAPERVRAGRAKFKALPA